MPHLPAFMAGAPSVPAGSHEMRNFSSDQDPPRSLPYTAPSVTPYLSLRARLSQVWINRWTILLLLVLARTLIAISGVNSDLASARREALSACSSVEAVGSAMASMPHYMSQGVNELTASGIENSVNALMQTTSLAVTGVEEIVVFVINMMTSTYLCLITFAVTGSLQSVISVMDSAQDQLNTMTKDLGDDMSNILSTFQTAYDDVKNNLKGVTSGLNSGINLPDLNMTDDITKLQGLQLPTNFDADLQKLNNSIPTFADVQNFTNNAIRLPFEEVKRLINSSLGTYTFDPSIFPVPTKEALTFCSQNNGIDDFFNTLVHIAAIAKIIFLVVLLVGAILVCIPMAYRETRRWRTMKERSQLVGSNQHDPMDVVYIVSRPYTSTFGIKVSSRFKSTRRQVLVRWVIAYATSDAALFVLALAVAGLFSCLCQYILLKSLEKEVPQLTAQVGDFADKVVSQLNNASQQWAMGTNKVLSDTNQTINEDLFGWVNTSTIALNSTLNTFVNLTMGVLNDTFGGTPLYEPITEVLNCLVLLKVAGIENGLTWIQENAHINLPQMPTNTFSVGAVASIAGDQKADSSFLAAPGDEASDKISSAVARFVDRLAETIETEAIISTFVLLIWIIMVLIGITRAMFLWFGSDKVRGEGGAQPMNIPPTPINQDFRTDDQDRFREFDNVPLGATNIFSHPLGPAPKYTRAVESENNGMVNSEAGNPFLDPKRESQRIHRESYWESDNKI